jgi:hypothetical protein
MDNLSKIELLARIESNADWARRMARSYGAGHYNTVQAAALTIRLIAEYRNKYL